MVKIHTLVLGDYQTNCYIVHEEASKTCAVIDPGYEPRRILDAVSSLGLTIDAILLTHGHFDHVGAVRELLDETECALYLHKADWSRYRNPLNGFFYPLSSLELPGLRFPEDNQAITAGGVEFTVLHTPGHTKGSVCYRCAGGLFAGDTLFHLGCGRTDLPGGNGEHLMQSLERLAALPFDCPVYPGHGDSTTLAQERAYNPYMRT